MIFRIQLESSQASKFSLSVCIRFFFSSRIVCIRSVSCRRKISVRIFLSSAAFGEGFCLPNDNLAWISHHGKRESVLVRGIEV